jgi:hypothetical protein
MKKRDLVDTKVIPDIEEITSVISKPLGSKLTNELKTNVIKITKDASFPSKPLKELAEKIKLQGGLTVDLNDRRRLKLTKEECVWLANATKQSLSDVLIMFN